MNLDKYPVISDDKLLSFKFLSEGPKGLIKKVIVYREIEHNIFNLVFGDWDDKHQRINDSTRSNNNDRDKVLATVALTVIDFMSAHPGAMVFAEGATRGKTRLYQMAINQHWQEINKLFDIEGFNGGDWEPFVAGRNYEAFTLKAKQKVVI